MYIPSAMVPSIYFLLPVLFFLSSVLAATSDEWRARSIYQVVTDRFATSDDSSASCDTSIRKYCGGSWKGIINHLDYIQNLGFDAVWISPVVANLEGETAYGEAYHGYWTRDINSINTHYGSADDLIALSTALHSRGMYLMVDVVVNHFATVPLNGSAASQIQTFNFSSISPFSSQSDYHPQCEIKDYNNQTEVEQCWLGDNVLPLPDLNTEDASIVKTMNDWIGGLVNTYKVDGLRIDTVKHVRKDFWPDFVKSAGVFTLGEVISDNTTYMKDYTEVIDSVFDYPTWFTLTAAFSSPQGNLSALTDTVVRSQSTYKNGAFMTGSFLENHDQPRFQSTTQDQALIKNAMAWPFIYDGIPILYYGQEQGYAGAADPNNREALWLTAYDTEKPLVAHVQSLNAARKAAITSNKNFLTTKMTFIPQSNNAAIAISKPPLVGLLTNAGNRSTSATTWSIPGSSGVFQQGETVVDILTCKTSQTDSEGGLVVRADSGLPQILMPMSALNKSGALCPSAKLTADNGGVRMKRGSWTVIGGAALVALAGAQLI